MDFQFFLRTESPLALWGGAGGFLEEGALLAERFLMVPSKANLEAGSYSVIFQPFSTQAQGIPDEKLTSRCPTPSQLTKIEFL